MSTYIINLNDTIAMYDSAVIELAKAINTCQPCVQETQTSCNDVKIAIILCVSVILVTFIIACLAYYCYNGRDKDQAEKIKELILGNEVLQERNKTLSEDLAKALEVKPSKSDEEKTKELLKDIISMSKDKDGITNVDTADRLLNLYNDIFTVIEKHSGNK